MKSSALRRLNERSRTADSEFVPFVRAGGRWPVRKTSTRVRPAARVFQKCLKRLVGVRGFEPPTPCSQSRCATGLRHTPNSAESLSFLCSGGLGIKQVLIPSVAPSNKSVGSAPHRPISVDQTVQVPLRCRGPPLWMRQASRRAGRRSIQIICIDINGASSTSTPVAQGTRAALS